MMPGTFLRHTGVGLEGGLRYEPKAEPAFLFFSAPHMCGLQNCSRHRGIDLELSQMTSELRDRKSVV